MEIFIDNKRAVLKKDTSFDYVSENRLFSGSDEYSMNIILPLKGCTQNLEIFGNINRRDFASEKLIYDCEIRDKNLVRYGSIIINEITESEVKVQFLEGRSESNFYSTLDDIFINELILGSGDDCEDSSPIIAWDPILNNMKCVALPWVNNNSGNIQNKAIFQDGSYVWAEDCKGRSWMPYLSYIVKEICNQIGYSFDFSNLENSEQFKYLIICNCIPFSWLMSDFSNVLPHWTVMEFFQKLGQFLNGEFTINHRNKFVKFDFNENIQKEAGVLSIENVVEEFSSDIDGELESKSEYIGEKNLAYSEGEEQIWKLYSCNWFIEHWNKISEIKKNSEILGASRPGGFCDILFFDSLNDLLNHIKGIPPWNGYLNSGTSDLNKIYYAKDVNAYFIIRALYKTLINEYKDKPNTYQYTLEIRQINEFGKFIRNESENAETIELEFIPASIDFTDKYYGFVTFLSFKGDLNNEDNSNLDFDYFGDNKEEEKLKRDSTLFQPTALQLLNVGESESKGDVYEKIYLGWWNGSSESFKKGLLPHPIVEDIYFNGVDSWGFNHISFRLDERGMFRKSNVAKINSKRKVNFKFISDYIPNPRAIFIIKGKKYICEKITSTFTENGMSNLLKGEFWPILE